MHIHTIQQADACIAVVSDTPVLCRAEDVLDLAISVRYESGADRLVLERSAFCDDFFMLSTGLAGEALQKLINYHFKLAIVGDFSHVTSKALRDLIRESNRGQDVFFVANEKDAIAQLCRS